MEPGSGLDFGDGACLLLRGLVFIFVVNAQVQPQVIQSLTDRQGLLTSVSGRDGALELAWIRNHKDGSEKLCRNYIKSLRNNPLTTLQLWSATLNLRRKRALQEGRVCVHIVCTCSAGVGQAAASAVGCSSPSPRSALCGCGGTAPPSCSPPPPPRSAAASESGSSGSAGEQITQLRLVGSSGSIKTEYFLVCTQVYCNRLYVA